MMHVRDSRAPHEARFGLIPAFGAWLAGLAVFTVLSAETLFAAEDFVFLIARTTAYVTAALIGAVMLALVVLFGLGCGVMLRWLDAAANARLVARAVSTSLWVVTAYMWVGVLLLLAWPPAPMTVQDVLGDALPHAELLPAQLQGEVAFAWIARLRYVVLGGFLALCVWRLARHVKWSNAVLAVGFGAALVSALIAGLGALAGALPAAP